MVPTNNWINTLGDLFLNLKPSELFQSCHRERYVAQFSHTFWFVMDVQRTCSRSTCSVDQVAASMPISVFLLIKTRNLLVTASTMTDRRFGACKSIRILSSCKWATSVDYVFSWILWSAYDIHKAQKHSTDYLIAYLQRYLSLPHNLNRNFSFRYLWASVARTQWSFHNS